jgi:colicin import membrane protein
VADMRDEQVYRPLGLSLGMHIALAVIMTVGWLWHTEQKTVAPPAMMRASLVYAPKSALAPQQKTQTQKTQKTKPEPPKPEPPKPEPPKPEITKPKEVKPEIKPTDKPSPIAAKPEPPKPKTEEKKQPDKKQEPPKPKVEEKKQPDKKPEPPKPDAKQAEKQQKALSQKQKEKISQDAEMAIEAMLNDEDVTVLGDLTADEAGKWGAYFANAIAEKWSRPPNARRGMITTLEIELLSNGQLVNVRIIESSGNVASDLAAESAVRKVEPEVFKEIIDKMGAEVFEKNFRKFNLKFSPEDLQE